MNNPPDGSGPRGEGPFGPGFVWMGVGLAAVALLGWQFITPGGVRPATDVAVLSVLEGGGPRLVRLTQEQCVAKEGRVWAVAETGVECISYVVSKGSARGDTALLYISGDIPKYRLAKAVGPKAEAAQQRRADRLAARHGLPVVVLGRPGLMGSTGFHIPGGHRHEALVLYSALDQIKARIGVRDFALAGQSGGARITAQMLTLGRRDVACAAMSSGAYGLPRLKGGGRSRTNVFGEAGKRYLIPLDHLDRIVVEGGRRSFVIGDQRDKRTPFPEQKVWAEKLAAGGHHVRLIEAEGKGKEFHGLSAAAITAAVMCAKGLPDTAIEQAVGKKI